MDEASSASSVRDASGHHNDGRAQDVRRGVRGLRGTAYRFNGKTSRIEVPDSPTLNPGLRNFSYSVTVRFTTTPGRRDSYDMLRKGTTASLGGEFKAEIVNINGHARARCIARGSTGQTARIVPRTPTLADGQWHVITCGRDGSRWRAEVDRHSEHITVALGDIVNSEPLTIGGKLRNLAWEDWYPGDIDQAVIVVGGRI